MSLLKNVYFTEVVPGHSWNVFLVDHPKHCVGGIHKNEQGKFIFDPMDKDEDYTKAWDVEKFLQIINSSDNVVEDSRACLNFD